MKSKAVIIIFKFKEQKTKPGDHHSTSTGSICRWREDDTGKVRNSMERLTYVAENGEVLFHPADLPDDEGITITQLAKDGRYKALEEIAERLANREQAEEQGLLLRLPISEDTPVYSIEYCCGNIKSNRSGMCFRGLCESCSDKAYYIRESVAKHCSICEINRSVFLTREEAEAKLKEMGEKDGR